jgi:hypothetical protein
MREEHGAGSDWLYSLRACHHVPIGNRYTNTTLGRTSGSRLALAVAREFSRVVHHVHGEKMQTSEGNVGFFGRSSLQLAALLEEL